MPPPVIPNPRFSAKLGVREIFKNFQKAEARKKIHIDENVLGGTNLNF
jgi:hypothetical protein